MKYILSHDFGTSALKSALFTVEGDLAASCSAKLETIPAPGGGAEQDPEEWWRAFCRNNRTLLAACPEAELACVGFCGTYPNTICLDENMEPIRSAITWQDTRTAKEAAELSEKLDEAHKTRFRGGRIGADRSISKVWWLKNHEPESFARIHKVLPSPHHFILARLTGRALADYRTGFSTGMTTPDHKAWDEYLCALAGITSAQLPELCERTTVAGTVPADRAEECGLPAGTTLVLGTGDGDSADLGMGMLHDGDGYLNGSTSASFLIINSKVRGSWPIPTSCSGASIEWMKSTLCREEALLSEQTGRNIYDIINERIASAPVGCHGVRYHPYICGDRGAINNPNALGSFNGISLETTHEDMLRAVYEGVGLNLRWILQSALDAGFRFESMPMVGGMSKSAVIRQIFADIFGFALVTVENVDLVGTMGTAVIAGMGVGIYEDELAYKKFVHEKAVTRPDMENHAKYEAMLGSYIDVYKALEPLYPALRAGKGETA